MGEYDEVVAKLRAVSLVRSSYFVLSGAAPYQGTIVTRWWDPSFSHTEDITPTGNWHVFQANDDNFGLPLDTRRLVAGFDMLSLNQSATNPATIIRILHTKPILMSSNVYLFVMSAKAGKFCSILGEINKNDDTSVNCPMMGWKHTLPADEAAWKKHARLSIPAVSGWRDPPLQG